MTDTYIAMVSMFVITVSAELVFISVLLGLYNYEKYREKIRSFDLDHDSKSKKESGAINQVEDFRKSEPSSTRSHRILDLSRTSTIKSKSKKSIQSELQSEFMF